MLWALYIIFGKRAGHIHGGQATSLGLTAAALVALPVGAAHAGTALLDPSLILAGIAVGVLSSALPYSLEMVALKRLPNKTFGVLLSMEPAMGAGRRGGAERAAVGQPVAGHRRHRDRVGGLRRRQTPRAARPAPD